MWRDFGYALRGLRRDPGFTLAVTLSLGLAIGANASIFGIVDGLWLRPPGVEGPGELVRIFSTSDSTRDGLWSFPEYQDLRSTTRSFSGVAVRGRRGTLLQLPDGTSELELVNVVSLDFFTLLGVSAHVGRVFGSGDADALDAMPGVVLGHAFWQRRYGGDPSIVGRTISFGRTTPIAATVLGVLPENFRELEAAVDRDMWLPPQTWARLNGRVEFESRDFRWFDVVARRRPGVSVEQAGAEVTAWARSQAREHPASNRGRGARVLSELGYRLEAGGVNAFALLGLVLLVVAITCVNVANLQLARAAARVKELGVRTALGASPARLFRQLMAENVLLGAAGAAAGLLTGAWVIRLLPGIVGTPPGFRAVTVFSFDDRVLVFTVLVTIVTTIAFGLAPSWLASRPDVVAILKGDASMSGSPIGRRGLRFALVATQVAVAIVMMTATGLFARSFAQSEVSELGFARKPVLTAWVFAEMSKDTGDAVVDRLRGLPGVRDVAVARRAPLSLTGAGLTHRVQVADAPADPDGAPEVKFNAVSANYFSALGIRVREGRVFSEADQRGGEPVIVVSELFARRFFPGAPAIGRAVRIGQGDGVPHLIVGVVDDVVSASISEEREPYFYLPYWRGSYGSETTFLVEAERDAAVLAGPVRNVLRGLNPQFDPRLVATLDELVRYSARSYRWTALLAAVLGAFGLLLTGIGVYGAVSLNTTRRSREIGIRLALGARRMQVLGLLMKEGAVIALAGIAIGVPGAIFAARLVSSLLFGVRPADLPSFAGAAALVLLIVLMATLLPARRAVRVPPSAALRMP
jgi:putative ABC transport system permease protein